MDVKPFAPASSQGEDFSVMALVEDWTPGEMEEKASYVLETTRNMLIAAGTSHEKKLDCISIMATKLICYVPIFELEDSMLSPFLEAVRDYLEEVFQMMLETDEENRAPFFTLICTLIEHTEKVVHHCMDQNCGVGEIPSLPRLVPIILHSNFSYLGKSEVASSELLKMQVTNCFSKAKDLLTLFISVMEGIKIRTVLEDELDILITLCIDLVSFHDVLIPLDFKLACMVWRLYVKMTTTYHDRLYSRLNLVLAIEVLSKELTAQLINLRKLLQASQDDGVTKVIAKATYLTKLLVTLGAASHLAGESPNFLRLLLELFSERIELPQWLPDSAKQKIEKELYCVNVKHILVKMASGQSFIDYFLTQNTDLQALCKNKSIAALKLNVELLLLRKVEEEKLFRNSFYLVSLSCSLLERNLMIEGRQVMGKSVTEVDIYCWILTNLCSWVSSITREQFEEVEKVLITVLVQPTYSPLACILAADIWCFLARYGTSSICLNHLLFLSSLVGELKKGPFSFSVMIIHQLMNRITNFLNSSDLSSWKERPENQHDIMTLASLSCEQAVLCLINCQTDRFTSVLSIWQKLAKGAYMTGDSLISSQLILALCEATVASLENATTTDLNILLDSIDQVARCGQYRRYMIMCMLNMIRVCAVDCEVEVRDKLTKLLKTILEHLSYGDGDSCAGVLVDLASREISLELGDKVDKWNSSGDKVDKWNSSLINDEVENISKKCWSLENSLKFVKIVNCTTNDEMDSEPLIRKVSPSQSRDLSISKKRKYSPTKHSAENVIVRFEESVTDLENFIVRESIETYRERILKTIERLQNHLNK